MAISLAIGEAKRRSRAQSATAFGWHVYAVVFGATCVMAGIIWDISWHMSIGRDTFWTPAHLLIQAGGMIAGLTSGYVALRTTFGGTAEQKALGVSFWGFRAPLGAWVCVWGCAAMVTSAPFDDWWHRAYGLDVKILSPPHTILMAGIEAIVVGALLLTLARQNQHEGEDDPTYTRMFAYAAGLLIVAASIGAYELTDKAYMHSGGFYRLAVSLFPFLFVGPARASRMKWPATTAAAVYMAVTLVMMWVMELVPATPKLGPIYQHITHMVGMSFPLLLIIPALTIDLLMQRVGRHWKWWQLAPALSAAFLITLVVVQWPFADFLMSPAARNWLFNADNFVYWMPATSLRFAHGFVPTAPNARPLTTLLALAFLQGTVACSIGLAWGNWMKRVRR